MQSPNFRISCGDKEFGDVNVGWNCGVLDGNRPYFLECWAADGMTILTFFISTDGIEDMYPNAIEEILIRNGLYSKKEKALQTAVKIFVDGNQNKMYSINVIVGDEDGTYLDQDCIIFPYRLLNELNS